MLSHRGMSKKDLPADVILWDHDARAGLAADRRRPEPRALFLAGMAGMLAQWHNSEEALAYVARMAMPELGAWCIVDVFGDGGLVRRVTVMHPDDAMKLTVAEFERSYPPSQTDALGAPRIAITQQPELVPEVDDMTIESMSRDVRHASLLRALGMNSYMIVPLKARGRLLGSFTFISTRPELRYSPKDLLFAEDLAGRAAMAMDNLRLVAEATTWRDEAAAAATRASRADRVKTDFLATMSHELLTPLNAIAGYAELLELGMRGPVSDQQREAIIRIRRSQQHLLSIVNDILTFAKTETGRIPLNFETVGVNDALVSLKFLIEPMLASNEIKYACSPCDSDLAVRADRERLQQILVNLLSNATKFSPAGGPVSVTAESRDHLVVIHVIDKGEGIEEDMQQAIFEPFVQASTGLTRTADGSGLGLTISRELARLMGGDVTVRSKRHEGSEFTLALPMSHAVGPVS